MGALRLTLVVTVIVALLAPTAVSAAEQEGDGTADSMAPLPLVVTGDMGCTVVDRGTGSDADVLIRGGSGVRDQQLDCVHTMSDARVSGTGLLTFNDDCFDSGGGYACVIWGTSEVVGPEGRWGCSFTGTGDPFGRNDGLASAVCRGTDAYEGLTYMWQLAVSFSGKGDFGGDSNAYGLVYEGPAPPVREAITDPLKIVVAKQDAVAGYIVVPTVRVVSAAEVGPDVFTDLREVKGRKAAVDIPAGTPITPDLLEPAE